MKEGNRKEGNRNGNLKIFVCGVARLNDNNTRKEYKWGEKDLKLCLNTDSLCCTVETKCNTVKQFILPT